MSSDAPGSDQERRALLVRSFGNSIGGQLFPGGFDMELLKSTAVLLSDRRGELDDCLLVDSSSVVAVISALIGALRTGAAVGTVTFTPGHWTTGGSSTNMADLRVLARWTQSLARPILLLEPRAGRLVQIPPAQLEMVDRTFVMDRDPEVVGFAEEITSDLNVELVFHSDRVSVATRGLELAAIKVGSTAPTLEVGVSQPDLEMWNAFHPGLAERPVEALSTVLEIVGKFRQVAAPRHPLNCVSRPQWLRAVAVAEGEMMPIEVSYDPVSSVNSKWCFARSGTALSVFMVGVDPSVLLESVAVADLLGLRRIEVLTPKRDLHPILFEIAKALEIDFDMRAVEVPWLE